ESVHHGPGREFFFCLARNRKFRKKAFSIALHSSSSTPLTTSARWLNRGSSSRFIRLSTVPPLGSGAPYTTSGRRDIIIAPEHMTHGSSVTYNVQSSSRNEPTASAAA